MVQNAHVKIGLLIFICLFLCNTHIFNSNKNNNNFFLASVRNINSMKTFSTILPPSLPDDPKANNVRHFCALFTSFYA